MSMTSSDNNSEEPKGPCPPGGGGGGGSNSTCDPGAGNPNNPGGGSGSSSNDDDCGNMDGEDKSPSAPTEQKPSSGGGGQQVKREDLEQMYGEDSGEAESNGAGRQSGQPFMVGAGSGQLRYGATDLSSKGFGMGWGQSRTYVNAEGEDTGGLMGNRWVDNDLWSLEFIGASPGNNDPSRIKIQRGASASLWFQPGAQSGNYVPLTAFYGDLKHDATEKEFTYTDTQGNRRVFYDNDTSHSAELRGQLKGVLDAYGNKATLSYDVNDELSEVKWSGGGSREELSYHYEYYDDLAHVGRLKQVVKRVSGEDVARTDYEYCGAGDDAGSENDLKSVRVEELDKTGGEWKTTKQEHYRYWKSGQSGGFQHGLKYVVGAEASNKMIAAGTKPERASEDEVKQYADCYLEYDDDRRVTKQETRGGASTYQYSYLDNSAKPGVGDKNTWATKSEIILPNGNKKRYYTNATGGVLLKVHEDAGSGTKAYQSITRNSDGRMTQKATSAAIASVTEPSTGSGSLSVNLNASSGLVYSYNYATVDNPSQGEVKGYPTTNTVQEGSGGSPVKTDKRLWGTKTVNGVSIHKPEKALLYVEDQDDANASTYQYSYTYYQDEDGNDTYQVKEKVTTLPVIPVSQNGDGQTYTVTELFDEYGKLTWKKDARGYISYRSYVSETGAMLQSIEDVDTTLIENVPAGWVTPVGGGLHLVTDYESDAQGRTVRQLAPSREAVLKESAKEATVLRTVDFTVYRDSEHETWWAQGYSTGNFPNYGYETVGSVSIDRRDADGRLIDEIQAKRSCTCGPLQTTESFPQEMWTRWTKHFYDQWGLQIKRREYFDIPESGEGFKNVHYVETRLGYDDVGRLIRKVAPGGTITRSVYSDARLVSLWVGTDDTGATPSDPTGNSTSGNNMVKVISYEYDDGNANGNGLLTKRIEHVDENASNDRVVEYAYDYRDWMDTVTSSDGTTDFITKYTYDNDGNPTQVDTYHTSVASGNLTGRTKFYYDNQVRVYKTESFDVHPTTGAVGNALVSQSWFDPGGNVIKGIGSGSESFTKTIFDGLNRPTTTYLAVNSGTSSDDNDVSNDTVVEQANLSYDNEGNLVFQISKQRFHDATGTGPLNGPDGDQPKARQSFVGSWFDGINRTVANADYGTNGGAELTLSSTVPERSDVVLVNSNLYAQDGALVGVVDPNGLETHWKNDRMGRRIRVVENANPDAEPEDYDANRSTEYTYTPDSELEHLTLINESTGNQVTRWVYGTTLDDSDIARGDLVRAKIYPMSDDESDPTLADGDDSGYERIEYSYNRLGQVIQMKDPNETVHDYVYNEVGQLLNDGVSAFGSGIDDEVKRISRAYNNRGLLATVTSYDNVTGGSEINQVEFSYNGFDQVVVDKQEHEGAVDGNTPAVEYGFADASSGNTARLTSMTYPDERIIDYLYDGTTTDDQMSRISHFKVQGETPITVEYIYVGASRYVKVAYPEPSVQLSYIKTASSPDGDAGDPYTGYDRFGRSIDMRWVTSSGGAVRDRIQYGYDRASNRTWRANLAATNGGQDEQYRYDGLYQVTSSDLGTLNINRTAIGGVPAEAESFGYDPTGNWTSYNKEEDGAVALDQTRESNKDNQLVQIDGVSDGIEYDSAGNATLIPPDKTGDFSKSYTLTWDAWNRLVKVEQGTTEVASYEYDGLYRRTLKDVDSTVTHFYYNNRWKAVEEREGASAKPSQQYIWGERPGHIEELVRRDKDTTGNGSLDQRLYCTMDYYNAVSILDTSGDVQERYGYSAFGVRRVMAPDFSARASSTFDWKFCYKGQFLDEESGYLNWGFRNYVPLLGRWINRDPIVEEGGDNLYLFLSNAALNLGERFGLEWVTESQFAMANYSVDSNGNFVRGHSKVVRRRWVVPEWQQPRIQPPVPPSPPSPPQPDPPTPPPEPPPSPPRKPYRRPSRPRPRPRPPRTPTKPPKSRMDKIRENIPTPSSTGTEILKWTVIVGYAKAAKALADCITNKGAGCCDEEQAEFDRWREKAEDAGYNWSW